jgi:ABC-2 type transport system ATP-binding protein
VPAVIQVEKLIKRFDTVTAVAGISFEVQRGEMFAMVGPDGAGKTTTIRNLCGLQTPSSGSVRVLGDDITKRKKKIQKKIGYLSQRFSLYGDLSIDENIAFFAAIHNVSGFKERREELLEFTRLKPFRTRLADRLSGGMKQKLALACSLIHNPEILFLDEPTTGVDPVSRRDFWKILSGLQQNAITIFMTTPYLDEAERCGRVALIHNGKLLKLDTPDKLKSATGKKTLEIVTSQIKKLSIFLQEMNFGNVQLFGDRAAVLLPEDDSKTDELFGKAKSAGVQITSYRITTPSLENVFIQSISEQETANER